MNCRKIIAFAALVIGIAADVTASAQSVQLKVKAQPDSPLSIRSARVVFDDPHKPAFEYTVVNNNDKPIRAYTIRQDDGLTGSNLSMLNSPLQPGQSLWEAYDNATYSEPVRTILLSVDFVEFADGTAWGPDTTRSSQRLAGMRTGMSVERNRLLTILNDEGVAKLTSDLDAELEVNPPSGNSSEWSEGFRIGTLQYRARLRRTRTQGGTPLLESILRQAVGAWERE